jgi:hypothetical protein
MNSASQHESSTGMITLGLNAPSAEGEPADHTGEQPRALTLVNLLLAWCFLAPGSGAAGFSKAGHCGLKGCVVALVTGLVLGSACVYPLWHGIRALAEATKTTTKPWVHFVCLATIILWIVASACLGGYAESVFFPYQNAVLKACRSTQTCMTLPDSSLQPGSSAINGGK